MFYKLNNGKTLEVIQDEDAQNPRTEWDNLGIMVCFHNRYILGDQKHGYDFSPEQFKSWADMKRRIELWVDTAVILPIYMYDHSGLTIKTTPFSCPWDSGQIGFIFVPKSKARKEYEVKRITKEIREKIELCLLSEVETYNQYLTGDVYGFKVISAEGEEEDSCWGFYGHDPKENGMLDHVGAKLLEEVEA